MKQALFITDPEFVRKNNNSKDNLLTALKNLQKDGYKWKSHEKISDDISNSGNKWDVAIGKLVNKSKNVELVLSRVFPCWTIRISAANDDKINNTARHIEKSIPIIKSVDYIIGNIPRNLMHSKIGELKMAMDDNRIYFSKIPSDNIMKKIDSIMFDIFMSNLALKTVANKWNEISKKLSHVYRLVHESRILDIRSVRNLTKPISTLHFEIMEFRSALEFYKRGTDITLQDIKLIARTLDEKIITGAIEIEAEKNKLFLNEIEANFNKILSAYKSSMDNINFRLKIYKSEQVDRIIDIIKIGCIGGIALLGIIITLILI